MLLCIDPRAVTKSSNSVMACRVTWKIYNPAPLLVEMLNMVLGTTCINGTRKAREQCIEFVQCLWKTTPTMTWWRSRGILTSIKVISHYLRFRTSISLQRHRVNCGHELLLRCLRCQRSRRRWKISCLSDDYRLVRCF